jgi:hypothetical protein
MPQKLEKWSNDQVLGFVRLMWNQWRQNESMRLSSQRCESLGNGTNKEAAGPVPPEVVAAAARQALVCLGDDDGDCLRSEEHERDVLDTSPLVPTDATLFERSLSGTIQAPTFYARSDASESVDSSLETVSHPVSLISADVPPRVDPKRKNRNVQWLRKHFHSLNEVGQLPFNYALMWQLHQYFFSPAYSPVEDGDSTGTTESADHLESETDLSTETLQSGTFCVHPSGTGSPSEATGFPSLGRALSYQTLSEVPATPVLQISANHKRHSESVKHSAKRTKNLQPRIAFYPRIRVSDCDCMF